MVLSGAHRTPLIIDMSHPLLPIAIRVVHTHQRMHIPQHASYFTRLSYEMRDPGFGQMIRRPIILHILVCCARTHAGSLFFISGRAGGEEEESAVARSAPVFARGGEAHPH